MENVELTPNLASAARQFMLPDVLTVEDLARALHVGPSAIRAHLRAKRIPGTKFGRRWLVARVELLRALAPKQLRALPAVHESSVLPSQAHPPVPKVRRSRGVHE